MAFVLRTSSNIQQIDSMLPCVCSVIDHRWRQNVVRTKKWHTRQNWTAKSTNLKKILDKSSQFLSSQQPCKPKSLDVAWKIAGVELIRSQNLRLRSTWGHSIRVLNERSVIEGGNLCPLWLVILKSVWNSVGDTFQLQYSWSWAIVSYTLLAAVPWNGLEH